MIWSRVLQFWGCISSPFMKRGARGDFLVPYLTKSPHICLIPCEEYADLKKKIMEYRGKTGK